MTGYAMCGSFCTLENSMAILRQLVSMGTDILPIMSDSVYTTDTRFGTSQKWINEVKSVCGRDIVHTIPDAEPLGPKISLDALIICPCTGNTLAKLANGITDTPACMAAKAHLRQDRPLLIALASNDAMSANLGNIAKLSSRKNIFFVPMKQDDPVKKPHSLVADFSLLPDALKAALGGKQLRKMFL